MTTTPKPSVREEVARIVEAYGHVAAALPGLHPQARWSELVSQTTDSIISLFRSLEEGGSSRSQPVVDGDPIPAITEAAPSAEWRPIETAPSDGTILLLYCPQGVDRLYASPASAEHYCLGFKGDGGSMYPTEGWWSVESRSEIYGYGSELTGPMSETECLSVEPTHWMPLPPPPNPLVDAETLTAEEAEGDRSTSGGGGES